MYRDLLVRVATGAALLAAATTPYPSLADEFVQKGVHEHGRATLTLAVDGAALTITLEAPAANVVGFEHPPKTADESAAVIAARRLLNDPGQLFAFPPAAACRTQGIEVTAPYWAAADGASTRPGTSAAAARREPGADMHSDYDATYRFRCANPPALAFVDALVVTRLRQIHDVRALIATESIQTEQMLSVDRVRVKLK